MDLNLQHAMLDNYQAIMDTVLNQEETAESIVPDAFPDISRIISTTGDAVLQTKQCEDGGVVIMGTSRLTVLYVPEGESTPKTLMVSLPFRCTGDCPRVDSSTSVHAAVLSVRADARMLNPRKLFVKAEVRVSVKAFNRVSLKAATDMAASDDSLQKQMQQYADHFIAAVVEKPFLFSDTLRISASKPSIEELLSFCQEPGTVEAKYIGKRLVCKGEMVFSALYRSGGELISAKFEMPFSQILDFDGGVDEGESDVTVALKSAECHLRDGELDVTVEALIQAVLWSQRTVTLLSDVYSTAVPLDVDRAGNPVCTASLQSSSRESARKFCESGIPAKQVLHCMVSLTPLTTQRQEEDVRYSTEANVDILYLSEDDALCSVSYAVPVNCKVNLPVDCHCSCQCRPVGEPVAVPVTGGFEVRLDLEFSWRTTKTELMSCVASVRQSGKKLEVGQKPSVVIRMVSTGETLWDVAKACSSTIKDICAANGLSSECAMPGTVLLIPTKR